MPRITRRGFLQASSAAASLPLLSACGDSGAPFAATQIPTAPGAPPASPTPVVVSDDPMSFSRAARPTAFDPKDYPAPAESGIDHVVIMMMENRSFDHMLGWVPGATGKQEGVTGIDRAGVVQKSYAMHGGNGHPGHLSPWQGCGSGDPNHGYTGGRVHLNRGKLDGWLLTDPTMLGDTLPLGYYRREDLPFYAGLVEDWTVCDRYHHALIAGTFPNRFYMHAGDNDFTDGDGIDKVSQLPTLWDALAEKGLSGRYYYSNLPFVGLWREKYLSISRPIADFLAEARAGQLPAVSFVDPTFESGAPNALSNDDHPHSDVRAGQLLMNQVYEALRASPQWAKTLFIINYDEWGGFFDHVVPPVMPPSERDFATWQNDGLLGFRVPCFLIGPRAKRGHVCHDLLEPNAILNFLSWRFGLKAIGSRSKHAGNLATALDFANPPDTRSRAYTVPTGDFGLDCQRYGNWPQIDPPGGGLPLANPGMNPGMNLFNVGRHIPDSGHAAEMRGLYLRARQAGFWIGPVVFPEDASGPAFRNF